MKKALLLLTLLASQVGLANVNDGETRTAEHTVSVSSGDEINILGKNTYLEIETWNKNEVSIVAEVTFDGRMTEKVKKFLDEFEENEPKYWQ